jgi:aminomethyltransferase
MDIRRTPLFPLQKALGAKTIQFSGWEMPVWYTGIQEEHLAVRTHAGLFDVSHMGQIEIVGEEEKKKFSLLLPNFVEKLLPGRAIYSAFLNEDGGVIDDLIVYGLSADKFLVVVNAGNTATCVDWLTKNSIKFTQLKDRGLLALQGPKSFDILSKIIPENLLPQKGFDVVEQTFHGEPIIIARTGYTGEDGFEIFCSSHILPEIWTILLLEAKPIGLGARDTLRLEVAYPLHGHELKEEWSILSSNVSWIVKFEKENFIGKASLVREKDRGIEIILIGLVAPAGQILRAGTKLFVEENNTKIEFGEITSGTKTPTVDKSIALARVKRRMEHSERIFAELRGEFVLVEKVAIPFYKR